MLSLCWLGLLVCACAEVQNEIAPLKTVVETDRLGKALGKAELPPGCLFEGAWHKDGSVVSTREACLRCACAYGALSCRRRACRSLPDPPPPRCHVRHRRGACCPELHCPDGVTVMELGASERSENDDYSDIMTPSSASHACVEGGSVFAAGSAMGGGAACETCFCLRGRRRCVRPTCLPPPHGCAPRPAPGACCPQRYYCHHDEERPVEMHQHDCEVDGKLVAEGERVPGGNCTACFCLRGAVRCQPMACAPPLHGCVPLLRPGDCCPHQYKCDRHFSKIGPIMSSQMLAISDNSLTSTRYDDRALHASKSEKLETTTKKLQTTVYTVKNTPIALATQNLLITTTKVKRKTNDSHVQLNQKPVHNKTDTKAASTTSKPFTPSKLTEIVFEETVGTDLVPEKTTEQPEGTVKIMINGTINCTAELSSSLPINQTNDTEIIKLEALPRIPVVNIEAQTYSPNDIITDRNVNGGFDENETFTINVTSSLMTNTSRSTTRPGAVITSNIAVPTDIVGSVNTSKNTKGDYDYDYTVPTLPPSLPNLKIIPFVAADAVVDDEPDKVQTYPEVDREDKFPVYYPPIDKTPVFATRREDTYKATQYPIFVEEKKKFPPIDITSSGYPFQNDLGSVNEYTVSTSLGSHLTENDLPEVKPVTSPSPPSSTYEIETPAVNLFSPPVETEGGFIPKGPGIIDEYYAVYPSTPPGALVPHLTTSMQLDIRKGDCVTDDGRDVIEGEVVTLGCLRCVCASARLTCSPVPCVTPPHCRRLPLRRDAECCGELTCHTEDKTTSTTSSPAPTTTEGKITAIKDNKTENITTKPKSTTEALKHETITTTVQPTSSIATVKTPTTVTYSSTKSVTATESVLTTTMAPPATTKRPSTTTTPATKDINTSQEYDDDEDEGFSFGSVLKLLLSDTYDASTTTTTKKPTTRAPPPTSTTTQLPATHVPFIPLPPRPYTPPKKTSNPFTVNRIDHLVLGEATAIKSTTPRPITNKTTKRPTQKTTTEKTTERLPEIIETGHHTSQEPRPPNIGLPIGGGLLKLAGCNIYGRMYRVGRIIAELSTPCQECWCTELGVQCKQLGC